MTDETLSKIGTEGKPVSLQETIEGFLNQVVTLGNYESAYFFSNEGLPLGNIRATGVVTEMQAVEISIMMLEIKKAMKSILGMDHLHEMVIESADGRKLVFRFIAFYGEAAILVCVVPPHKSYRGLTNRIQKAILKLQA